MLESCALVAQACPVVCGAGNREEKTDLELRNNIIRIGKIEEVVIFKH